MPSCTMGVTWLAPPSFIAQDQAKPDNPDGGEVRVPSTNTDASKGRYVKITVSGGGRAMTSMPL